MKRLGFYDFAALPAGTLFYHYTEWEFFSGQLFRKEETIFVNGEPTDFFETALSPSLDEVLTSATPGYATARWALYEFDTAEFVVLEPSDIQQLLSHITSTAVLHNP